MSTCSTTACETTNWETTNDCRYRAIGVGGAVTGFRADVVIIDDPIRGRAEAESMVARAHLWDWFNADLLIRLKPRGVVVLIATPYHEDDCARRVLRIGACYAYRQLLRRRMP